MKVFPGPFGCQFLVQFSWYEHEEATEQVWSSYLLSSEIKLVTRTENKLREMGHLSSRSCVATRRNVFHLDILQLFLQIFTIHKILS